MASVSPQSPKSPAGESFAALFEESLNRKEMRVGEVITAEVVSVDENFVVVNAGLKSESVIAVDEFRNDAGQVEVKPGDRMGRGDYELAVFDTDHRADTVGFALVEHDRLGRFNPERAKELGIPEGPLWGRLHKGETVTLPDGRAVTPEALVGPPRPGRMLVYTGDTRPHPAIIRAANGADLLIHEATFGEDERARAIETGHATAREAAEVARESGVRRLVLTHISPRYSRDAPELLAEAQAVFPETVVARDGMTIEVPFPV